MEVEMKPFSASGEPVKGTPQFEAAGKMNRRSGVPEGEQRPVPSPSMREFIEDHDQRAKQQAVNPKGVVSDEHGIHKPEREPWARPAIDGHRPDSNPKSALGIKKAPIHLVSPISILHEAMAMAEGGMKYGPYNYREDKVAATVYIAAALRHILAWSMGEENASDSNLHHLGHGKACLGILLDAQAHGSLIDDRHKTDAYAELIKQYEAMLPLMAERISAMKADLEAHNR